jgi:hypothetical protein
MKTAASAAGRAISTVGDRIVKIQEPEASRRERLRTQWGGEVGRQTGLFVVPEIVAFDDVQGEIVFERLRLTDLRQVLSQGTRTLELVGRAALALAAIHAHPRSSGEATPITSRLWETDSARMPVPLHGDFGLRNLFYLAESDRIALIDWSNADWIAMDGDIGAPEIDVAVFLISLFHRRLFDPRPIAQRHGVARHFLTTYTSASPHGLDHATLRAIVTAITPAFVRLTRYRKGHLHSLGCRHALVDLDFFLRRLSHPG